MLAKWEVYYDDGRIISDKDCTVDAVPAWGVLVIRDNLRLASGTDYYVWDDRGEGYHWWEMNQVGLIDYLARPGWKKVLFGRIAENELFQSTHLRAYWALQEASKND